VAQGELRLLALLWSRQVERHRSAAQLLGAHGRRVWRVDAGEAQLEDGALVVEQLAEAADRVRRLHVVVLLALEPRDERAADVRLAGVRARVRGRFRVRVRVWVRVRVRVRVWVRG
jgi:hypothetical protein